MAGKKGELLCPICDSPLELGSKKCGFCGTDLTIFDTESEAPKAEPKEEPKAEPVEEESTEDRLDEIFFGANEEEKPAASAPESTVEQMPEPVQAEAEPEPAEVKPAPTEPVAEPIAEEPKEEPVVAPAEPEPTPVEEFFECPECGGKVGASAKSCPSCGVIFADEGADMFQCPACNTLVNVDAKSCPGCGAMFVESEEEAADEESLAAIAQLPRGEQPKFEFEKPVSQVVEPDASMDAEAAEAEEEPEKKGLFGGLFGKKKKKKREAEDEDVPESEPAFPSILRRAPEEDEREALVEPEEGQTAQEVEPTVEVRPEPVAEPKPMREVAPEPVSVPPSKPAPFPPRDKAKGKELARLTAEIQPLLRLANEKGVDVSEGRKLVDNGAMSVRARQMDDALETLTKAKESLLETLKNTIEQMVSDLRSEAKVARDLGGEVSRAVAYLDELEKALKTGDFEAVYVYAEKAKNELLPITGRYNESKQKITSLRGLVSDSEVVNVNTRDARTMLSEAARAFESNDFDKVDLTIRSATERLYKDIEPRLEEEIRRARDLLVELKERGQNITPMITVLKSARTLMKSKDYTQALREMREFKDQVRKAQ